MKRGLKVGVDERFVSFAEESKEFASLVYIHGAFTFTNDDLSSQHGEKLVVAYSLEALTRFASYCLLRRSLQLPIANTDTLQAPKVLVSPSLSNQHPSLSRGYKAVHACLILGFSCHNLRISQQRTESFTKSFSP